jgi:glucose/arabinose dehydrogenase
VAPLLALGLLAACGAPTATVSPSPSHPGAPASPGPSSAGPRGCPGDFGPPPPGTSANQATALAFAPDGRLFFAERGGTVRVFQGGRALAFATVPTVTTEPGGGYSERGLLGLAVSPTFATDRRVYAFYSADDRTHQRVIRWTDDCQGHGTAPTVVVDNLPSGADCCHKGGRIAFGPDGNLYVTLGDNHQSAAAQDRCDVRGKVLRYTPAGGAVAGNLCGAVFDYGLRNPFGIAFSPDGRMLLTNNGPSGDAGSPGTGFDTVYLSSAKTEPGLNFQWPACYGYAHPLLAASCPAGSHPADYSTEAATIVPTGATWVSSGRFAGHFVFCSYNGGLLRVFNGPRSIEDGPGGCSLDVKQGPDDALYLSDGEHINRLGG